MKRQATDEIIIFLKNSIEPSEDVYGFGYRASAYLTDGTFLPCVIFRNPKTVLDLAMKRFDEERNENGDGFCGYYEIVKSFVTHGNHINDYNIACVEKSRYAFPLSVLNQIEGETLMAWTGFVVKMRDGKYFTFGTSFSFEFFDMPDGYSVDDIEEIVNHSYVTKKGEIQKYKETFLYDPDEYDGYNEEGIFRERPYFDCYVDDL